MSRTIDVANILRRVHMPADRDYLMEIETDGTPETTGLFKTPQNNDLVSTETGWTMTGALAVPDGITSDLTGNVTGDVSGNVTGNVTGDVTGELIRLESEFRPCSMQPDNIAGTEWARGSGSPIYVLGASQTSKILFGYVTEPEGRILTGWKTGGGYTDADASITCTAQLFSYPLGVETAVGAAVTFTPADGRWSAAETLAEAVVLAADTVYALKITATTGAGDELTCDYCRIAARG